MSEIELKNHEQDLVVQAISDMFVADGEGVLAPNVGTDHAIVSVNPCMPAISLNVHAAGTVLNAWEAEQLAISLLGAARAWRVLDEQIKEGLR